MTIEDEFQNYLRNMYEEASALPPDMITELRRAFYSGTAVGISLQSKQPMLAAKIITEIKNLSGTSY